MTDTTEDTMKGSYVIVKHVGNGEVRFLSFFQAVAGTTRERWTAEYPDALTYGQQAARMILTALNRSYGLPGQYAAIKGYATENEQVMA